MFLVSSNMLFFSTLLLGIIISITSNSWLMVWVGMELNLLSFTPLIMIQSQKPNSEAAIKYFLIQAMPSILIIALSPLSTHLNPLLNSLITTALLIKMGAAPFHLWLPSISNAISWANNILLLSIQKITPLTILSVMAPNISLIKIAILSSSLIGSILGLKQTLLRKLMAYSSINHMAWMLTAMMLSTKLWLSYFLIYLIMITPLFLLFNLLQLYHLNDITNLQNKKLLSLTSMITMLSLGGLPPLLGFLPKWMIIQMSINNNLWLMVMFLAPTSIITLFFYLRITLPPMLLQISSKTPLMYPTKMKSLSMSLLMMNFISFPLLSLIIYL